MPFLIIIRLGEHKLIISAGCLFLLEDASLLQFSSLECSNQNFEVFKIAELLRNLSDFNGGHVSAFYCSKGDTTQQMVLQEEGHEEDWDEEECFDRGEQRPVRATTTG